jgi:hypothetical protein
MKIMKKIVKKIDNNSLIKSIRVIFLFFSFLFFVDSAMSVTYTVTTTADSGAGSLRDAIQAANGTPEDDTIVFNITSGCSGGVCTITLTSGTLVINSAGSLTITNAGGSQRIEISGNNSTRVFFVNSGANLTIDSITIRNGSATGGNFGGGINNSGTVTITNSTITNNSAGFGGGINNSGTVTITNSTITNNSATVGGGIRNVGTVNITNSTITNNSAGLGGGITNGGTVNITNSTITNNSATVGGDGGGIYNSGGATVNARNTIIANNSAPNGPDFSGTLNSQGYNLIRSTIGTTITGVTTGNITGQDPQLAPLGNYGGPTQTQRPLPSSPVINAGDPSTTGLPSTDQRGAVRVLGGRVDIGAVEITTLFVTNTSDSGADSLRNILSGGQGTPVDIIRFNIPTGASGCSGGVCVITLNSPLVVNPGVGSLAITNAGGNQRIEISGNNSTRVFEVNSGANLTIDSITIRNGSAGDGGGIRNNGGTVNITNSTITNNSAFFGGGIVNVSGGTVNITNSTITNNSASGPGSIGGGGILNFSGGTVNITNSTITNNSASGPGSIGGGGIRNLGTVNARNTIIANNSASNGPDFSGTLNSLDYNLIENTSGATITGATANNILGQDPLLTPLGYYGGPTWTRAPISNSPAIDGGDSCVKTLSCSSNNPPFAITKDQRGVTRTRFVDIGAYESNAFTAVLPNARAQETYDFMITQYNLSEGNFIYQMVGLPSGLSLQQVTTATDSTVRITGSPTQTGNFTPILNIIDTNTGSLASVTYLLFVAAPTAASVEISGRVLTPSGGGLLGALVTLTDQSGNVRVARTTTFGYYRFTDIEAGQTVVITVRSKRYEYQPQVVFVASDITELNFYPDGYKNLEP